MGFISAFSNFGSIGSTTKWAIKMYDEIIKFGFQINNHFKLNTDT